ncbi:myc target protein 1 [Protopterus annectens]|uniref:myc target protein 1 n=1 Tax=Protopterus annectens TaxID=7888 RepID=UPI001CF9E3A7|nr:myc target protein 1 [Protopterus annectens]
MDSTNKTSSSYILGKDFWDGIKMSFILSMVAGLIIAGLIWMLLLYLSRRRKASAAISPAGPARHVRASAANRPNFYRNNSYDRRSNLSLVSAAALTFQRQASMEQDAFTRKPSFRASTFHPFLQCSPLLGESNRNSVTLPGSNSSPGINRNSLVRSEPQWTSNSLRGFHSCPSPPPAYETVIKAYQETCT